MTMDNLDAEHARKLLGQLVSKARDRRLILRKELEGFDREGTNVDIGHRIAKLSIEEDREVALEELDQIVEVLEGPPPPALAEEIIPPSEPPKAQETEPQAATPPPPQPPVSIKEMARPDPSEKPHPDAGIVPFWRRRRFWVLILAVVGGVVAFVLAGRNVDAIARLAFGSNEFASNGLFQFIVVATTTIFGVFLGGWIGSRIDEADAAS